MVINPLIRSQLTQLSTLSQPSMALSESPRNPLGEIVMKDRRQDQDKMSP